MPTNSHDDTDAESALATVPRWAALPMVLAGGIGAISTGQFSSLVVAQGVGLTIVITLFTAMHWWPLRRFPIFWIVTTSVLIIHLLFVLAIPWPTQDRVSKVFLLILVVDIFGVIIISDRLERRTRTMRRCNTTDSS